MSKQKKRQKCDVYSRVVGFITPTSQWNRGKKEEWKDRVTYDKQLKGRLHESTIRRGAALCREVI